MKVNLRDFIFRTLNKCLVIGKNKVFQRTKHANKGLDTKLFMELKETLSRVNKISAFEKKYGLKFNYFKLFQLLNEATSR